jgi:hypothetical protein
MNRQTTKENPIKQVTDRERWLRWSLIILLMTMFLFGEPPVSAGTEGGGRFIARNPVVSPPVAPGDNQGLPRALSHRLSRRGEPVVIREAPRPLPLPGARKARTAVPGAGRDSSVQQTTGSALMPDPICNFEGMAGSDIYPPDTDGQVGPNHFVQIVNHWGFGAQVRVFDKIGTQLYDFGLNQLWPDKDPCRDFGSGDPVVLYDQIADRWILTQFALPDPPYYECFAVSRTATPTDIPGDWHVYSFLVHQTKMNDYPKIGVWPDGYYMSVNQFDEHGWAGAGAFVFDRSAILSGGPAAFQYFDLFGVDPGLGGMLPSNLMGSRLPPAGSPNYFGRVDREGGAFDLFEFHVDWANPANSTFALTKGLPTDPFEWKLCAAERGRCIDQPGPGFAPKLEALNDRLMMHLWYRNTGSHGTLVTNHTVNVGGGIAGIRWYEIRGGFGSSTTFADAAIHQQGTYGPTDATHRWMGSIAMDRYGNLALGYSASNATNVYPSVRYVGRLAGDPPGTLPRGEVTLIEGSGSQTGWASRWGDYSAMSVDPVDDRTFWYTQEYYQTTGPVNWQTRIGAFRFDSYAVPALYPWGLFLFFFLLVGSAFLLFHKMRRGMKPAVSRPGPATRKTHG